MALALVLAGSPIARAADRVRVLVIYAADGEASRRLRAELGAAGLEAISTPARREDPRSTLAIARAARAVAALRLVSDDDVEVLVIDPETGVPAYSDVVRSTGRASEPRALRAVEQLRARLVKLQLLPEPAGKGEEASRAGSSTVEGKRVSSDAGKRRRSDIAPSAEADRAALGRADRRAASAVDLWLSGSLGATAAIGGLPPGLVARALLRLEVTPRWAGSVFGLLPLTSQSVHEQRASADVDVYLAGGLAHYSLIANEELWEADLGLGGALVVAAMRGRAETPALLGRAETVFAGALLGEASTSLRLATSLRLRAALLAGLVTPRPAVQFEGRDVGYWGRPFGTLLLGAEIDIGHALGSRMPSREK